MTTANLLLAHKAAEAEPVTEQMKKGSRMRVGVATDHGGFGLKKDLVSKRKAPGHAVVDFGVRATATLGPNRLKQPHEYSLHWRAQRRPFGGLGFRRDVLEREIQPGAPSATTREGCPSRSGEILLILERKSGGSLCVQR